MEISLCLIVRNEEKRLKHCLQSFLPLTSEIIVVDTGSTDGTKQIAESCGAEVVDFEWIDDFSAARNVALERATCEWVMMVDADDAMRPDDAAALKKSLEELDDDVLGVMLPYGGAHGGRSLYRARIWRRDLNARYVLAVHEYLAPSQEQLKHFVRLDFPIIHTTPAQEFAKSMDRNIAIMKKALEEGSDEPRYLYYMGHDHQSQGDMEEAVKWYTKFVERDDVHTHEKNRAYLRMAQCLRALGDVPGAQNALHDAIDIEPHFIEPHLLMADILQEKGLIEEAIGYAKSATKCRMPKTYVPLKTNLYNGYAQKRLEELLSLQQEQA